MLVETLCRSFDFFVRFSYKHAAVKWEDSVFLFKGSQHLLSLFFRPSARASRPQHKTMNEETGAEQKRNGDNENWTGMIKSRTGKTLK